MSVSASMFDTVDIDALLRLITLREKREIESFCRKVVIHSSDFAALIMACEANAMPWMHLIHVRDYVPEHLHLMTKDREALQTAKAGPHTPATKKATNKIFQFFEERRWLVGHIFFNEELSDWHFFYFDQRDRDDERNHWVGGPHVHFINCVWPNVDPQKLWENFCTDSIIPKGAFHVRYKQHEPER